jgi:hypothetical protein
MDLHFAAVDVEHPQPVHRIVAGADRANTTACRRPTRLKLGLAERQPSSARRTGGKVSAMTTGRPGLRLDEDLRVRLGVAEVVEACGTRRRRRSP